MKKDRVPKRNQRERENLPVTEAASRLSVTSEVLFSSYLARSWKSKECSINVLVFEFGHSGCSIIAQAPGQWVSFFRPKVFNYLRYPSETDPC